MIKLDDKYSLENNNIHGVELVFKEKRIKDNKKTNEKEVYTYEDRWYYPNPLLAMNKWIELTNTSTDIKSFTDFYKSVNENLNLIYKEFVSNNRKL